MNARYSLGGRFLKDAFTQNTNPVSLTQTSSSVVRNEAEQADESVMSAVESSRLKKSATVLGLALSMGATGMLLPNHSNAVLAADALTQETGTTKDIPLVTPANTFEEGQPTEANVATENPTPVLFSLQQQAPTVQTVALANPSVITHQVKAGDTLWNISQAYQIDPATLAASNHISPTATLAVGSTLTIPKQPGIVHSLQDQETPETVAENYNVSSNTVKDQGNKTVLVAGNVDRLLANRQNTALNQLKSERQQLGNSLNTLQTPPSDSQVAVLSQPPVQTPSVQPVVIPVPTPETITTPTSRTSTTLTSEQLLPAPKLFNNSTTPTTVQSPKVQPESQIQTAFNFTEPIPIPVPSPENTGNRSTVNVTPQAPVVNSNWNRQPINSVVPVQVTPTPSSTVTGNVYRVQPGDTLDRIASRYGVDRADLMALNQISNPNLIKINQPLTLPTRQGVQSAYQTSSLIPSFPVEVRSNTPTPVNTTLNGVTKPTNTQINTLLPAPQPSSATNSLANDLQRVQQTYGTNQTVTPTVSANNVINIPVPPATVNSEWQNDRQNKPNPTVNNSQSLIAVAPTDTQEYNNLLTIPTGETVSPELPGIVSPDPYLPNNPATFNGYIWPARGVLTSGYGRRWGRMHKGIDIAGPIGTPVMAAADGEVIFAGWNSGGYGNLVKVRHNDGSITFYAHNSRILVRTGQFVSQGEQLSEMGSTGYSTGPHLHFEVHPTGQGAVNPIAYLPQRG